MTLVNLKGHGDLIIELHKEFRFKNGRWFYKHFLIEHLGAQKACNSVNMLSVLETAQ